MKNYFNLLKSYKMTFPVVCILLLTSILTVLENALSKGMQIVLNNLTDVRVLIGYGVLGASVIVVSVCFSRYRAYLVETFARKGQQDIHEKMLKIPVEKTQEIDSGKIYTAIHSIPDIAESMISIPKFILDGVFSLLSALVFMFMANATLTWIVIIETLPIAFMLLKFQKKIKPLSKQKRESASKHNNTLMRLNFITLIKSFAKESYESKSYNDANDEFRDITLKKRYLTQDLWTTVRISYTILDISLVIYYVVKYYFTSTIDIPELLLFSSLQNNFINPFLGINEFLNDCTEFDTNTKSNAEILNEADDTDGKINLSTFESEIEFKDVAFKYKDSDEILRNVNLTIPKGKHVGIYGESGAGKSTLINLLLRFFKVTHGSITIDGIDINELTEKSLRKHIGVVTQEVEIFSDMTIYENIVYGMEGCSESQVIEAAKKANAHSFITKLEKGYDSYVGNNGVKLSGGERQRISLARLFLLDPDILILDEATSKLDNNSEDLIKESIEKLSAGKTVISIAHRFTTIEDSDVLIGIKDHTIYESGTREELAEKKDSLFNKLYRK